MLIGIDSSPCSLSLENRSTLCSTTKCHQNKSDLKNIFVQKSFFFQYLLFFQSQSCLLESTAANFRQSAGYVWYFLREYFNYFHSFPVFQIYLSLCVFLDDWTYLISFKPLLLFGWAISLTLALQQLLKGH